LAERLENLGPDSWQEFLSAPRAVLVLGKSDCDACARWSDELTQWLTDPARWPDVRFGKLMLNTPGLIAFKRANPWVASIDMLPHTIIYRHGDKAKEFAGGGVERLETRLRRAFDPSESSA
jgi:hypothetical protein